MIDIHAPYGHLQVKILSRMLLDQERKKAAAEPPANASQRQVTDCGGEVDVWGVNYVVSQCVPYSGRRLPEGRVDVCGVNYGVEMSLTTLGGNVYFHVCTTIRQPSTSSIQPSFHQPQIQKTKSSLDDMLSELEDIKADASEAIAMPKAVQRELGASLNGFNGFRIVNNNSK